MIESGRPFHLFQSAKTDRENSRTLLFSEPRETIICRSLADIQPSLNKIDRALKNGYWVAGALAYEAGFAFESRLEKLIGENNPILLDFSVYGPPEILDKSWVFGSATDLSVELANIRLDVGEDNYSRMLGQVQERIHAGDTYQVNLTCRYSFDFAGDILALYQRLVEAQPVSYAALIRPDAERWILSLSPELFFRTSADCSIFCRPMKGTVSRGRTLREDRKAVKFLRNDPKNRAENVMIVDMIRNDLGRICETGSVKVDSLFDVETYRTLHQMTSGVSGRLQPEVNLAEIFRALFPCASITGAPKVRTMEIIHELEKVPRGIYCGALGFAAPNGESVFSVAIRTLEINSGSGKFGAGGGIVADSRTEEELAELKLKASFLTDSAKFEQASLIETMAARDRKIELLGYHLDRLGNSARYFGYPYSRKKVREEIRKILRELPLDGTLWKIRLLLDCNGLLTLEKQMLKNPGKEPLKIALYPEPLDSGSRWFRHKTTHREFYDRLIALARENDLYDIVFFNLDGFITEGSITNIYLEKDDRLFTPPLRHGLLEGVYRRWLKKSGRVRERKITVDEFLNHRGKYYLSNAVIGLRQAHLIRIKPDKIRRQ